MDLGPEGRRDAPASTRRAAAERLAELPDPATSTWIWSDGSADGGVTLGGGGAVIYLMSGEVREVRVPAGALYSSTRAELAALHVTLELVLSLPESLTAGPVVVCLDSQAALTMLSGGASAQVAELGARIWTTICTLRGRGHRLHIQWVPAHCGLPGNERADQLAKEASALPQEHVAVDGRTITKAIARAARKSWQNNWPVGWYRHLMRDRVPPPVLTEDRAAAVNIHQLRAGHWGYSEQYLHRIGRRPTPDCQKCRDLRCPAARCLVCGSAADTPFHVLVRCPCLAGWRLRSLGNIYATREDLTRDDVVATLAAGYLAFKDRVVPSSQ